MKMTRAIVAIGFASAAMVGYAHAQGMTEAQARAKFVDSCSNVGTLSQDMKGSWHTVCSKGAMMVDSGGKVVADKTTGTEAGILEGHARAIATDKCSNVSALKRSDDGSWMGSCSKGLFKIDQSGKFTAL